MMMGVLFPHLDIHGAIPKRKNIFPGRNYFLLSIFIIDSEFNLIKSISCITIIGINKFWNFKKVKDYSIQKRFNYFIKMFVISNETLNG